MAHHAAGVPQTMNVVVFSGTTEGRALSYALAELGAQVTVCVATEYGKIDQGFCPGIQVRSGRLEQADMIPVLQDKTLCIDATHPYATQVTQNIREAAAQAGVVYKRLLRPASQLPPGCLVAANAQEAVQMLQSTEGNILLTTGAKELLPFASLGKERLYARVLPLESSLHACAQAGIQPAHIIAMQGPFGAELNKALLHQYSIRYLVTKDGGSPGGFWEKWEASQACDVQMVVIRRPEEDGESYQDVLDFCKEWMAGCR